MTQPILHTPRLTLRPRTIGDLDASVAMDREPGTTRWIDGPWDDRAAHEAFVEARIRGPYPPGLGYWVISRSDEPGGFLGWVLLIPEDATGPRVEIGWRLITSARGSGYAPEAAATVMAHGFEHVGLTEIVAEIHRDNHPSRRVARKAGMQVQEDPCVTNPDALLYAARIDCAGVPERAYLRSP
ncbi:MAG: GNAT family N-acetyltransferase [Pseudomonadota bacterium]